MPTKVPFQPEKPDMEAVRAILLAWIRSSNGKQLSTEGSPYEPYVEYIGAPAPRFLAFQVMEAFWQLVVEGILAPGMDSTNSNLPWFHVTAYGERVLKSVDPDPHDPTGYLDRLRMSVREPDATVLAYLAESLQSFRRNNHIASTILLGIAAERVFLLLSSSLFEGLGNPGEKSRFQKLLERAPMKPKLDWVHSKVAALQQLHLPGFPDNASIAVTTTYDLLRTQRNELGHPREDPPSVKREDALVNLQVFPRYYQITEEVRDYVSHNKV